LSGFWYNNLINKKIRVDNKPIFVWENWHFKVKHCSLFIEVNDCENIKKEVKIKIK